MLFRLIFSIFLFFLSFFFLKSFFFNFHPAQLKDINAQFFFLGLFIGGFFWLIFGRKLAFFAILEHELTHMIVGLIFFRNPKAMVVEHSKGGAVLVENPNIFIFLAPYYLPTFSYLALPFYYIIKTNLHPYFFLTLGAITGYHIVSTAQETKLFQPDILYYGIALSISFIIFANILFLGMLYFFVVGKHILMWKFIKSSLIFLLNFFKNLS